MTITTLLVFGSQILHTDDPVSESESEIIYEDILYPKHIIVGYQFVSVDVPNGINLTLYRYNGTGIELAPVIPPYIEP